MIISPSPTRTCWDGVKQDTKKILSFPRGCTDLGEM